MPGRKIRDTGLMLPSEAAARLGVTTATLLRWAESGKISYLRTMGGHRRFHVADVEAAREAMGRKEATSG